MEENVVYSEKTIVSIIIVNFNKCELTKNCISSIIRFTKRICYEIIVIDNNSTECDLEETLRDLTNPGNITLIKNKENFGFAKANNQGLSIAKGQYILYLNNDTLFIENTLQSLFEYVYNKKEKMIVGCKLLNEDGSHQFSIDKFDSLWDLLMVSLFFYKIFPKSRFFNKYYQNYSKSKYPFEVDMVKGAFMFAPTDILKKMDGFDERFYFYGEEKDLCYRFRLASGIVIYFPNTSIVHLNGASTKNVPWFKYKNQTISRIKYFQKHYGGIKFIFAIIFYFLGLFIRVPLYFLQGVILFKKHLIIKSYFYLRQLFIYPKNQFHSAKS